MKNRRNSFRRSVPMILVSAITLLLLLYVGFWEASRQYSNFQVSKMATQGEIIKNSIESYLHAGLPIEQYSSFYQLSRALLESDNTIEHISVKEKSDKIVFVNNHRLTKNLSNQSIEAKSVIDLLQKELALRQYKLSDIKLAHKSYQIKESTNSFKVSLELKGKFGSAGRVMIESNKELMLKPFKNRYKRVFIAYAIILIVLTSFMFLLERLYYPSLHKATILKTVYALSFLAMSGVIFSVVFQVYEQGAQAKTKALTDSMVSRLNSILDLGVNLEDISGINETLSNYKKSNPDIREISLIENGVSKYHTNKTLVGKQYISPNNVYEYRVKLNSKDSLNRELFVSLSLPVNLVHKAILSSANEFLALVIACALISLIFIDAGTGLLSHSPKNKLNHSNYRIALSTVKPAYFLIVFVHALSISFLPNLVSHLAQSNASSFATISLPFTLYYAMFALVLIPAGQYAEKGSLKRIMLIGCTLEAIGLVIIVVSNDYWWLIFARVFAGAGQGFFLIGLQSFLLAVTPKQQRTQGAAVKVIARNAGLISGTAIGSLLFSFTDARTVFIIGSVLSLITLIYLWVLVPNDNEIQANEKQTSIHRPSNIIENIILVFKDWEFVKSLFLVAIPGKMAITGVIMFASPLLLSRHGFTASEIGQALMLYYIASIIMTHYASRLVDSLDISRFILFMSSITGGISIILLGFSDVHQYNGSLAYLGGEQVTQLAIAFNQFLNQTNIPWLSTAIILCCMILAGISNGLLTSPIITHISKTAVAEKYGIKSVTATYTFLERVGHMLGPLFIGFILVLTMQSNIALSFFGFIIFFFGIIFMFTSQKNSLSL